MGLFRVLLYPDDSNNLVEGNSSLIFVIILWQNACMAHCSYLVLQVHLGVLGNLLQILKSLCDGKRILILVSFWFFIALL